jgi:hypothetical protein
MHMQMRECVCASEVVRERGRQSEHRHTIELLSQLACRGLVSAFEDGFSECHGDEVC